MVAQIQKSRSLNYEKSTQKNINKVNHKNKVDEKE